MADIGTAYIRIAPNMSGIQGKIAGGLKGSGTQFSDQFAGEVSGRSSVIIGAIAGIAASAATKGMDIISSSIGDAIKRVDTLKNAQKTFQYMGFAADDAKTATTDLTKSILGLPTPLDGAVRGMTALAATYGDVKLGQKVFSALNDAILGFGGTAAMVDNAIQQVSQLPMDGPLDAQTWNSLRNSGLTPVLVAMSKDFGISVSQMKDDFGSGKLTVKDFTDELTKMDTKGGGGLVSLQTIAHNATSGIGTGFANMQTAVTRGLAAIINTIGQKNISDAISKIGKAFEETLKSIATGITFVEKHRDIFAPIAVAIGTIVTALIAWAAITKIMTIAQAIFNAVMAANPITIIILAIAGLVAGLVYFFTKTELGKKVWQEFTSLLLGEWELLKAGFEALSNFFQAIWNAISGAVSGFLSWFSDHWRLIIAIVLGPLGLLIDFVTAYWSQITGAISTAVNAIWGVITGVFNAVVGFLSAVFSPIIDLYINIWGTIFGVIGGAVSSIWDAISGTFGKVVDFLSGIGSKIIDIFVGANKWLFDAGVNIVKGLIDGAGSILKSIGKFFLDMVPSWIVGPFKKALGISSPSKVFAGFGGNITEGLARGLNKGQGIVQSAVGTITDTVLAPITGSISPQVAFATSAANTVGPDSTGQAAGSAGIVQNNNIYNQVDLNTVTRELAWQIRR